MPFPKNHLTMFKEGGSYPNPKCLWYFLLRFGHFSREGVQIFFLNYCLSLEIFSAENIQLFFIFHLPQTTIPWSPTAQFNYPALMITLGTRKCNSTRKYQPKQLFKRVIRKHLNLKINEGDLSKYFNSFVQVGQLRIVKIFVKRPGVAREVLSAVFQLINLVRTIFKNVFLKDVQAPIIKL